MTKNMRTYLFPAIAGLLVAGLFFSYQPQLYFGNVAGTNLEISIAQICIALFICAALPTIWTQRALLKRSTPLLLLVGLALFSTITVLYTPNLTRGLLFTALLWGITALWAAILAHYPALRMHATTLKTVAAYTLIALALFSWYQIFGEAAGISTVATLLPTAYTSAVFGFARPTGFALEPQFLGSLLIAPVLYTAYLELQQRQTIYSRIIFYASLSVFLATLSRGAYVAVGIGGIILLSAYIRGHRAGTIRLILHASIVGMLTVGLLCGAAQLNQRDTTTGVEAIAKAVNQLSLGVISLPVEKTEPQTAQPSTVVQPASTEGYVASSTDSRVSMASKALALSFSNPVHFLFGVGAGGFGATVHADDANLPVTSVVNNQYLETFAELGLIGLSLFVGLLLYCMVTAVRYRLWVAAAIIAAYCIQWLFFSGTVNTLHVWAVLAVLCAYIAYRPKTLGAQSSISTL